MRKLDSRIRNQEILRLREDLKEAQGSNKALEKYDVGDYFPIYGICLGFELISMIVSKDNNILEAFVARNEASSLQFVDNTNIEGFVFQSVH
ncbi:gamma-glutamyl hydrolase 2-like isoform X2 [Vicia villosa]|uniref:gamma-glutamyl hydrolase 2-like isoform X2 n=1 Tax=Vicia villosa TaxID=3911 RepID=UPI00273BA081|nr:gamma-glutamyl hydrolase 2-like isoform X2 [Vicia villosa]